MRPEERTCRPTAPEWRTAGARSSRAPLAVLAIAVTAALAPVPARAQAPPDTATTASADSTTATASTAPAAQPPPRRFLSAWTADRRTYELGDVLTVFVDERTLAMASADEYVRDDRRLGVGLRLNSGSRFGVRLDGDASSDERGVAQRDERFRTELSVRVVEIAGNAMRVEGTKKFQVDSHEQEVTLRGWVRTQDVDGLNVVEGWRLADLEMLYSSNGELIKPNVGILQRIFGIIF